MKSFKARVVAAWIVALPIAYALVVQTQHRADPDSGQIRRAKL